MILNFNTAPCGKTYYEMNKSWKYVKQRVKQILDEKESCREYKIDMIVSILENYKETYLVSKKEK
jgi:hypothetical protein